METLPSHSSNPPPSTAVTQSLSSILNNPLSSPPPSSWSIFAPSPPAPPLPPISRAEFQPYLSSISESFPRFSDVRTHTTRERSPGRGQPLASCLREVPSLFFKEDFALQEGAVFLAACPFSESEAENGGLQERLGHYLDVVEMHLVREIEVRSDSFFEAQGQLEGLNGEIVEACGKVRGLREGIRVLTGELVGPARSVRELNATRGNLVELNQMLVVILYVSQALAALKLVGWFVWMFF